MSLFITPFSIALGALVLIVHWMQRKRKIIKEDNSLSAATSANKPPVGVLFKKAYGIIASLVVFAVIVLFFIPEFSSVAAASVFFGAFVAAAIIHFAYWWMQRLSGYSAVRTGRGRIETAKVLFTGGSLFGVFILGSILVGFGGYYILAQPTAIDLAAFALGTLFSSLAFKLFIEEEENPSYRMISFFIDILETTFIVFVVSMIALAVSLPSSGGVIALPLLLGALGIIALIMNATLLNVGASTNVLKNIFLSVSGSIVLEVIVSFPILLWALSGQTQSSINLLWLSLVLGFVFPAVVYTTVLLEKRWSPVIISLLLFLLITLGGSALVFIMFGGLEHFSLFILGLSVSAIVFTSLFGFVVGSNAMDNILEKIEVSEEQKIIAQEMDGIGERLWENVRVYPPILSAFSVIFLLFVFQGEALFHFLSIFANLSSLSVMVGAVIGLALMTLLLIDLYYIKKYRTLFALILLILPAPLLIAAGNAEIIAGFLASSVLIVLVGGRFYSLSLIKNTSTEGDNSFIDGKNTAISHLRKRTSKLSAEKLHLSKSAIFDNTSFSRYSRKVASITFSAVKIFGIISVLAVIFI